MSYVTNDPYRLQAEVRTAYRLRREGLLTDKEFADVVSEAVCKYTNVVEPPSPGGFESCSGHVWGGEQ